MRLNLTSLTLSGALLLSACATAPGGTGPMSTLPAASGSPVCETSMAAIYDNYPTARVNGCRVIADDRIEIKITPEKATDPQGKAINDSPWYGFRVDPKRDGDLRVRIGYENGTHRYPPKLSFDGKSWEWLSERYHSETEGEDVDMTLPLDRGSFLVSAQEIFTPTAHKAWSAKIAQRTDVRTHLIGQSREGRDITMLELVTEPEKNKPYVVIVGRQHPPEVTGALGLMPFAERMMSGDTLSDDFLAKYNVIIVPLMNPDGVVHGNWRFNMGGMDLNRDWRDFTQPETRAIRDMFDKMDREGKTVAFFLDFHSTKRNLVYTQHDSEETNPPGFDKEWLERTEMRLDKKVYTFTREPRKVSQSAISKTFVFKRYGVPAVTFELGDNTDRKAIDYAMPIFAEEMMTLLLEPAQ